MGNTRRVGSATVSKIFQEFDHEALISGNVGEDDLVDISSDLLSGMNVEIEFINEAGEAAAVLELPVLDSEGNLSWTARVDDLPIGTYTINEVVTGVMPDREYVSVVITENGHVVSNNQVMIAENTTIGIGLANRYIHYMGDIRVAKAIQSAAAGEEITIAENLVFYVDVYKAVQEANGEYSYTGAPVTTIEVRRNVSGNWVGTSVDIPVGEYYLVERTGGLNAGGNTFVSGIFENPVVTVTTGEAPAYVNLTNTYRKDKGTLTVEKTFEGLPEGEYPESIHIKVLSQADNALAATLVLTQANGWKASTQLPLGTYYLEEVTSAGETGTADVEGYGHSFSWDSSVVVFDEDGDTSTNRITNTYVQDYGTLTIRKAFDFDDVEGSGTAAEAEKAAQLGIAIEFLIQKQEGSDWTTVDSMRMAADENPAWEDTVHLPVGTYRIVERGARLTDQGYTFEGLSVSDGASSVDLKGDAAGLTGFNVQITGTAENPRQIAVTAVNAYSKDRGVLRIVKRFSDDEDTKAAKALLDEIDVLLYKDGVLVDTVTLSEEEAWEATIEELEIGEYLLLEVEQEQEASSSLNTAYLDDYSLTNRWDLGAEVEVVKYDAQNAAQTVAVRTLTNTYTRKTGVLEIYKRFENIPEDQTPASVEVDVKDGDEVIETITLTGPNWHVSNVVLPVGTYTLEERADDGINGYTQTGTTFKIFDQNTDGDETQASTAEVTIEAGSAVSARIYLTNTYRQNMGVLTVEKTFEGLPGGEYPESIHIKVLSQADNALAATLVLTQANGWKASTQLPLGTYYLEEVTSAGETGTADVEGYGHSFSWDSSMVEFKNHGETSTKKITNTYVQDYGTLTIRKAFDFDDVEGSGTAAEAEKAAQLGIAIEFLIQKQEGSDWTTVDSMRMAADENPAWEDTVHLPVGTYRIVERGARLTDQGYTFEGLNVSDGTSSVDLKGDVAGLTGFNVQITGTAENPGQIAVTAVNAYSKDRGVLRIVKRFSDDEDTKAAKALLDEIDVLLYKDNAYVKTVTLSANTSPAWEASVEDLEIGEYSLLEVERKLEAGSSLNTAYLDDYSLTNSWDPGTEVEVVKYDAQNEVQTVAVRTLTNTYTRKTGVLEIYKYFENIPADKTPASVVVDIKAGGQLVQTITLTGPNWHVSNIVLPVGTYTLEERADDEINNYTQTSVTFEIFDRDTDGDKTQASTAEVTVEAGSAVSARVNLTNTYTQDTGYIKVRKQFADDPETAAAKALLESIGILVKNADGETVETLVLSDPEWEAMTQTALPAGEYTLEEAAEVENYLLASAWTVVEGSVTADGVVNVVKGGVSEAITAEVTNAYTQYTGDLTVSKTVESSFASDKMKEFEFSMELGQRISKTYEGVLAAQDAAGETTTMPCSVIFTDGKSTFQLKDGQSLTILALPVGVGYTVTETLVEGFATTILDAQSYGVEGTVTKEATIIPFVNTREISGEDQALQISKTVVSPLKADAQKSFSFTVQMDDTTVNGACRSNESF